TVAKTPHHDYESSLHQKQVDSAVRIFTGLPELVGFMCNVRKCFRGHTFAKYFANVNMAAFVRRSS
ncbi:MAG TPA: hypothetical protein VN922_24835, partial [Bacteroidia bacterium]|nr:hypothetical protein [Bacteroidia bacterium]